MLTRKKNLIYIQPLLASYRSELVEKLAGDFSLTIVCGNSTINSGFRTIFPMNVTVVDAPVHSLLGGRFLWQSNVRRALKREESILVLTCANIRDLSYWRLLFWARCNGIKVYSHGQGLYKKRRIKGLTPWLYKTAVNLSHRYICYTELSRQSMLAVGCPAEKLVVAENSICFDADATSLFKTGAEQGVLFVGRLRKECNLEQLVAAVARLREHYPHTILHVAGSGELEQQYRARFDQPWVKFYGAVYDDSKILEISRSCRLGCYPGNAGLSVVHYLALRLPVVVHDDMPAHMGPEPSYILDGVNGVLFSREQKIDGLTAALEKIWAMPAEEYLAFSSSAFSKYIELNTPSFGSKMIAILKEELL